MVTTRTRCRKGGSWVVTTRTRCGKGGSRLAIGNVGLGCLWIGDEGGVESIFAWVDRS